MTIEEAYLEAQAIYPNSEIYLTERIDIPQIHNERYRIITDIKTFKTLASGFDPWEKIIAKLKASRPSPPFGLDFDLPV